MLATADEFNGTALGGQWGPYDGEGNGGKGRRSPRRDHRPERDHDDPRRQQGHHRRHGVVRRPAVRQVGGPRPLPQGRRPVPPRAPAVAAGQVAAGRRGGLRRDHQRLVGRRASSCTTARRTSRRAPRSRSTSPSGTTTPSSGSTGGSPATSTASSGSRAPTPARSHPARCTSAIQLDYFPDGGSPKPTADGRRLRPDLQVDAPSARPVPPGAPHRAGRLPFTRMAGDAHAVCVAPNGP